MRLLRDTEEGLRDCGRVGVTLTDIFESGIYNTLLSMLKSTDVSIVKVSLCFHPAETQIYGNRDDRM